MLRERDFRLLLEAVRDLNQPRSLDEFRPAARRVTAELVGCETLAFNEVDVQTGGFITSLQPISPIEHDRLVPVLLRFIHQNPAIVHLLQNPDSTTLRLADFIAQRDFFRTALYHEVFRHVSIEQQAIVCLGMHGNTNAFLALNRVRGAFSSREVAVLDALRPHLIQAYDNTRYFSPTRCEALHAGTLHEQDEDRVLVVNQNRLVFCSEGARLSLQLFFGECGVVPAEIACWLHAQNANSLFPVAPLRIEKAGRTLVVRRNGASEDGVLLLLQEIENDALRIDMSRFLRPEKAGCVRHDFVRHDLMILGLTSRQSEVLELVSRGLPNREIAHQLAISAHTVRHHLEAIYTVLGVSNRHAASNAARQHSLLHSSLDFPQK